MTIRQTSRLLAVLLVACLFAPGFYAGFAALSLSSDSYLSEDAFGELSLAKGFSPAITLPPVLPQIVPLLIFSGLLAMYCPAAQRSFTISVRTPRAPPL